MLNNIFSGVLPTEGRVIQAGYKADRLPLPSAEVNNEWNCTSTPPICLRGVCRENFYLNLYRSSF
jgi:hypothetical protein